jgi:acetyl-CoA synthetase
MHSHLILNDQYNIGHIWSKELELKIRLHVANKVSSIATPQELFVIDSIPKNKSGKIMRRVLKARYMGTDVGDISTLEI